jgi:hypothetical protein
MRPRHCGRATSALACKCCPSSRLLIRALPARTLSPPKRPRRPWRTGCCAGAAAPRAAPAPRTPAARAAPRPRRAARRAARRPARSPPPRAPPRRLPAHGLVSAARRRRAGRSPCVESSQAVVRRLHGRGAAATRPGQCREARPRAACGDAAQRGRPHWVRRPAGRPVRPLHRPAPANKAPPRESTLTETRPHRPGGRAPARAGTLPAARRRTARPRHRPSAPPACRAARTRAPRRPRPACAGAQTIRVVCWSS